jgi:hypothetical protein
MVLDTTGAVAVDLLPTGLADLRISFRGWRGFFFMLET